MNDTHATLKSVTRSLWRWPEDDKEDKATEIVLRAYTTQPRPAPPEEQGGEK